VERDHNRPKKIDYTELGVLTPKTDRLLAHNAQLTAQRNVNRKDKTDMPEATNKLLFFGIMTTNI